MTPEEFDFKPLMERLLPFTADSWSQSEAFVLWFLINVFRLDDAVAQDAVCDGHDDKGVDAIFVDDDQQTIFVIQSKLSQNTVKTLGDTDLKEFSGTLTQFASVESVETLEKNTSFAELKRVLKEAQVAAKLEAGYLVSGIFLANRVADASALKFVGQHGNIELFDRTMLSSSVIDVDYDRSIDGEFTFDISYAGALGHAAGADAALVIAPVTALELVSLKGIEDATLFQKNVRLSLGSTKVNKDIAKTIQNQPEHDKFILYHNGVTILCKHIDLDQDAEKLTISGYSVVNGAQSLTTLFKNLKYISADLRVLAKFIELDDEQLAARITWNSNNQNAIKYRDQRSNDALQRRLQKEFEAIEGAAFAVKQGEDTKGKITISNEDAGLLILAYDMNQPWVCHQKYKVFDELYKGIFSRPIVTASYIWFIHILMEQVMSHLKGIESDKVRRYVLTRYFLLYCLKIALDANPVGEKIRANPGYVLNNKDRLAKFMSGVDQILNGLVYDLNGEIEDREDKGEDFEYKDVFKSPEKSRQLAKDVVGVYRKELKRGKVEPLDV